MRGRALVVDDDALMLEVLELRLASLGLTVTATQDAEEAIAAVVGTRFDLAFVDLRMEPMDGILLMEAYMSSVEYSKNGRRVRMIKKNGADGKA